MYIECVGTHACHNGQSLMRFASFQNARFYSWRCFWFIVFDVACRLLADTEAHCDVIIAQQGVKVTGQCLKDEASLRVVSAALKTLAHLINK